LAILGSVAGARRVEAQFAPPVISPTAKPGVGAGVATNPNTNPYMNPYLNPYLNPAMTQVPMGRNDSLLYFMAAQQTSGMLAPGAAGGRSASSAGTSRAVQPAAPSSAGVVGTRGYFNDNPMINDRAGRMARQFPATGSNGGGAVAPDRGPMTNPSTSRYFNRYARRNVPAGR
jgi:hypothetical protein